MPQVKRHRLSLFPAQDDKRNWGQYELWRTPAHVDVSYWQGRINDIFGAVNGEPIIRLVWAWEPEDTIYTDWDSLGRGIKAEKRPRYEFLAVPLSDGRTLPICAPRWVLEERQEPEQFLPDWEASRYVIRPGIAIVDPSTGQPIQRRVDLRGAPPQGAHYIFARYVAVHEKDKTCCDRARKNHEGVCFGFYRNPDEHLIGLLQKAKARHAEDDRLRVDPFKPLAQQSEVQAEIDRQVATHNAEVKQKLRDDLHNIYKPWNETHGWRAFTSSYKALKHGKWQSAYPVKQFVGQPETAPTEQTANKGESE